MGTLLGLRYRVGENSSYCYPCVRALETILATRTHKNTNSCTVSLLKARSFVGLLFLVDKGLTVKMRKIQLCVYSFTVCLTC